MFSLRRSKTESYNHPDATQNTRLYLDMDPNYEGGKP